MSAELMKSKFVCASSVVRPSVSQISVPKWAGPYARTNFFFIFFLVKYFFQLFTILLRWHGTLWGQNIQNATPTTNCSRIFSNFSWIFFWMVLTQLRWVFFFFENLTLNLTFSDIFRRFTIVPYVKTKFTIVPYVKTKISIIWNTSDRRAKRSEIWDSRQ